MNKYIPIIIFFITGCSEIYNFSEEDQFRLKRSSINYYEYADPSEEILNLAIQNDPKAQMSVGIYISNKGNESASTARKYLKHAAENGFAEAYYHLGLHYFNGYKIKKAKGLGGVISLLQYFTSDATTSYKDAKYVSYKKAYEYFELAAQANIAEGQNLTGFMLIKGLGTNIDKNEACHWFDLGAKNNHEAAQLNYASYCLNDDEKRVVLSKIAENNALAAYELAIEYLLLQYEDDRNALSSEYELEDFERSSIELIKAKGIDVPSSFTAQKLSDYWMKISAEGGYSTAKVYLER